ncbi:MAG: hypothetical protein K6F79_09700 [Saccharofermentans sp.]|nr:hypothetical protein [Saccharofermentans sp.]
MININLIGYYDHLENYKKVEDIAWHKLRDAIDASGIRIMQVTSRVKSAESVMGKLRRKPDHYSTILDMTDVVGMRVICYFADKIDAIGDIIKELFVVDEENSIDRRNVIAANTFGYMSLHNICSLRKSDEYDDELTNYRFEVQIRTVLQHTWAEIEHDLGYKTEFGVPRHIRREFSRMASLLEVADEGFMRIKNDLKDYTDSVISTLESGDVENITIDAISIGEFIKYNAAFNEFTKSIAAISGAELITVSAEQYINQLEFINIHTLKDILVLLEKQRDHAMLLAKNVLENSEIDELASTVGLYFLCRAHLIWGDYNEIELTKYFDTETQDPRKIARNVTRILSQRERYVGKDK